MAIFQHFAVWVISESESHLAYNNPGPCGKRDTSIFIGEAICPVC
jgi:hypothetical protein